MSIIKSFKQQSDMYVFGHINEEHMMINIDKPSIFGVPYFQTNPCPAVHTVMNWDHPKRGGPTKDAKISQIYIYMYIYMYIYIIPFNTIKFLLILHEFAYTNHSVWGKSPYFYGFSSQKLSKFPLCFLIFHCCSSFFMW